MRSFLFWCFQPPRAPRRINCAKHLHEACVHGGRAQCRFSQRGRCSVSDHTCLALSTKRPWDATAESVQEHCGDNVNELADADADVAVLAKRLWVSNLSGKGDDRIAATGPSAGASISAHAAGGEGVGVEGAVGQRTWSTSLGLVVEQERQRLE